MSSTLSSSIHGLAELVPKLTEAIAAERKYQEDAYVARVCLAEVHWLREDLDAALKALAEGASGSQGRGSLTAPLGWIEVCDVKAALMKVAIAESHGKTDEARSLCLAAAQKAPGSRTPELRRWTERLLARGCMFMRRRPASSPTLSSLSESLRCFLTWTDFWQRAHTSTSASNTSPSYLDIPRRQVWKAYYDLLSTILQSGLIYNPLSTSPADLLTVPSEDISHQQCVSAKLRQRGGLKRVESSYESLLLNETQFPKASQTNAEVEEWTQQVFDNWKIFCSSQWTDEELGDGGKEGVGRGVLDILYRAATKTFHSVSILRQLFHVHAAAGEFELAMHAFSSYVELVDKAKARAEKTGKHELGFENNDTVIVTAAEAVRILCRYGDRDQGERAVEVGKTIRRWLDLDLPSSPDGANARSEDNRKAESQPTDQPTKSKLQPETLSAAHRALGIGMVHWARLTYETDSRSQLQAEGLEDLQKAQTFEENSIETSYALASLLVQIRDIQAAVQVIKRAIANSTSVDEDEDKDIIAEDYTKERRLVPMWHLLALCLTAQDDYEQAAKMCEAAFEQFGDLSVLFGEESHRISDDSDEKPPSRSPRGLIDQMEGFEKEVLIQVKMSQLTLIELMEGVGSCCGCWS